MPEDADAGIRRDYFAHHGFEHMELHLAQVVPVFDRVILGLQFDQKVLVFQLVVNIVVLKPLVKHAADFSAQLLELGLLLASQGDDRPLFLVLVWVLRNLNLLLLFEAIRTEPVSRRNLLQLWCQAANMKPQVTAVAEDHCFLIVFKVGRADLARHRIQLGLHVLFVLVNGSETQIPLTLLHPTKTPH